MKVTTLAQQKMRQLIQAAVDTAGEKGGNVTNAVIMGYCFGGAVVLEFARSGADLKGFASFHGGIQTPEGQSYEEAKGSVLVLHGTADDVVSMTDFANLAVELEQTNIPHEMITYSGAPHAFTVFDTDRYREDADMKSWQRYVEYLAANLKVN